jgi:hypothetical protein
MNPFFNSSRLGYLSCRKKCTKPKRQYKKIIDPERSAIALLGMSRMCLLLFRMSRNENGCYVCVQMLPRHSSMHWMMVTSVLKLIFRKDPDFFFLFSAQTWFPEQFSAAFLNSRLHCNLSPTPCSLCLCVCAVRCHFTESQFLGFLCSCFFVAVCRVSVSLVCSSSFFLDFLGHVWFDFCLVGGGWFDLQMWVDAGPCQAVYLGTRCDVFFFPPSFCFFTCFGTSKHFNSSRHCFLW